MLEKIANIPERCTSSEHNPPKHQVLVENLIRVKESWNTSFISDKFLSAYNNLRDAYNREIAEREKK